MKTIFWMTKQKKQTQTNHLQQSCPRRSLYSLKSDKSKRAGQDSIWRCMGRSLFGYTVDYRHDAESIDV